MKFFPAFALTGAVSLIPLALLAQEPVGNAADRDVFVPAPKSTAAPAATPRRAIPVPAKTDSVEPAATTPATPAIPSATPTPPADYVILDLNGEKIMNSEVQALWANLFPGGGKAPPLESFGPAVKDNVVRGIVSERLMVREAERQRLGDKAAVKDKLAALRRQLLVQELLNARNDTILSEPAVKKAYEDIVRDTAGKEEIRARHILVEDKALARNLVNRIKKGEDFAKLAKEHSIDKGSAVNGGDLGYFNDSQMVPEFSKAAFAMKKGDVSDPVESSFGWHVIEVEDRRQLPVPTLAEARPDIEKKLVFDANQKYVDDLLKESKVTYFNPQGEAVPFPVEAPKIPLEPGQ